MKNITTIILLMATFFSFSQEDEIVSILNIGRFPQEEINKTYYYQDLNNDFDKFLGTWKFENSEHLLIAVFYLEEHVNYGGDFVDRIYTKFKYEHNGVELYNTLSSQNYDDLSVFRGSYLFDNLLKISLSYREPTDIEYDIRSNSARLYIEYLPCSGLGCDPQIKWEVKYKRSDISEVWPFKIPADLVLTKQ